MSYHILHQFDEQWLADLQQETDGQKRKGLADSFKDGRGHVRSAGVAERDSRRWKAVAAGVILATFALLFSIEAGRRAEFLEQRVNALEQTAKK
jgi:hypothetical protein